MADPITDASNILSLAWWPLEVSIAWLGFGNGSETGRILHDLMTHNLSGMVATFEQNSTLVTAQQRLWSALQAGRLTANGIMARPMEIIAVRRLSELKPGPLGRVPAPTNRKEIPALEWLDLTWVIGKGVSPSDRDKSIIYSDVRLRRDDVVALGSTVPTQKTDSSPQTRETKASGGAPKKYSEVDFMIEVFRIIYEGAPFASQADLNRKAIEAYNISAHLPPGEPSFEWAKPYVRQIWISLELGRTPSARK